MSTSNNLVTIARKQSNQLTSVHSIQIMNPTSLLVVDTKSKIFEFLQYILIAEGKNNNLVLNSK